MKQKIDLLDIVRPYLTIDREAVRTAPPGKMHDIRELLARVAGVPIEEVDAARRGND